jgi:5-methylcytosine-specific restriction enzyme subunit McrC
MSIPVQNLYYLLTYAWDRRLDQSGLREVEAAACPNLNSLFARVLANGVRQLVRRGLDRSYVQEEELTSRIRGRIDFPRSARRQTWKHGKMDCSYDELSHDVLHNRILKGTLLELYRDPAVGCEVRLELARLLSHFEHVRPVAIHASCFRRVQLHRNNRAYRFLLQLCELVHRSHLPDRSRPGRKHFRDILGDEKVMASIFEKFIRNFAARHLTSAVVSAMHIEWDALTDDPTTRNLLPLMKTDVTIKWPHRKLILDCKYYREALKGQFDRQRFLSGNLYQIHAYLMNKAVIPGWENAEGMLLYPTNGIHLDQRFVLNKRHPIRVVTLNLNQSWEMIHKDLLGILA